MIDGIANVPPAALIGPIGGMSFVAGAAFGLRQLILGTAVID